MSRFGYGRSLLAYMYLSILSQSSICRSSLNQYDYSSITEQQDGQLRRHGRADSRPHQAEHRLVASGTHAFMERSSWIDTTVDRLYCLMRNRHGYVVLSNSAEN
jgi:hypothetical protein